MAKKKETLRDLKFDAHNANLGSHRGNQMIETSLRETGAGRSIVVDKNGIVIGGNKTLEQWLKIANDNDLEIVETDGDKLVVVKRNDLDLNDPESSQKARQLAVLDNRTGEVNLNWDPEVLLEYKEFGLDISAMWDEDEFEDLIKDLQADPPEEFPSYNEQIPTEHECPKCGYTWSGSSASSED